MSKNIFRTNKQSRSGIRNLESGIWNLELEGTPCKLRVRRWTATTAFAEFARNLVLLVSLFLLPLPALELSAAAQKTTEPANG